MEESDTKVVGQGRWGKALLASFDQGKLGGLKGKERGKKKEGFGKRVLELPPIKKMLLAVYNKIFSWYYS